jgi:hypothetical protein
VARRAVTPRSIVVALRAWLACSIALITALVWNNMDILGDGFWTMAAGRIVLETHALPGRDPYAYTSTARRFILQMPATEIGLAWLGDHAGLLAVIAAATLAVAAAVTWVWLEHARSLAARMVTLPVAAFVVILQMDDLSVRGQAFGDLAFAALLACMAHLRGAQGSREISAKRRHGSARARAWAAPIALGAAWANLHPSFLLGVVVPLAWAAASLFDKTHDTHDTPTGARARARAMATFAALFAAGTILNPYGPELLLDVVRLASNPTTARIDLFLSPDFHSPWPLALVALSLATLLLCLREGPPARRTSDAAMVAVFLVASCVARRYAPLAAMVDLATLGGVADTWLLRLPRLARDARAPKHGARTVLLIAALASAELALAARLASTRKDPLFHVPAASAAFIAASPLPDHVFAPYHWGGYLEWAWRGRRKVFVDGRNQLFPASVLEDARAIEAGTESIAGPTWDALLDIYELRTALAESGSMLDARLRANPAWTETHRDARAAVYVRSSPTLR